MLQKETTMANAEATQKAQTSSRKVSDIRGMWQKQSNGRRTVSFVERELGHVIRSSPFLQKAQGTPSHVGLFHRSEIQVGHKLGAGGFSDVFEITGFALRSDVSEQLSPQQRAKRQEYADSAVVDGVSRYAIKQLQKRLLSKLKNFQHAAADLAIEAAFMKGLDHPYIMPLRGLPVHGINAMQDGSHDGYFLIMDRLEETLEKRIKGWKKNEASINTKVAYAYQLADALRYLHQRRIVFRDVKPMNIGISRENTVILFDFGLARELPPSNDSLCDQLFEMSGVGTRRYMSPEAILTGMYNCKADVYSWSLIFWEMLSNATAYENLSMHSHSKIVCEGGERPPIEPSLSWWVRDILVGSWAQDVGARFTMEHVYSELHVMVAPKDTMLEVPESPKALSDCAWLHDGTASSQNSGLYRRSLESMSEYSVFSSCSLQEAATSMCLQLALSDDGGIETEYLRNTSNKSF